MNFAFKTDEFCIQNWWILHSKGTTRRCILTTSPLRWWAEMTNVIFKKREIVYRKHEKCFAFKWWILQYTLFEISSQNDWIYKAHYAIDATQVMHVSIQCDSTENDERRIQKWRVLEQVDQSPVRDTNPHWGWFFILFVVVNNFFLLNLFIGVIYEKYLAIRMAGLESAIFHVFRPFFDRFSTDSVLCFDEQSSQRTRSSGSASCGI